MSDHFFDTNEEINFGKGGDLPHWGQKGKLQWVTFRLGDSLSKDKLVELDMHKQEWLRCHPKPWTHLTAIKYRQEIENKVERWLDAGYGSCILKEAGIAKILVEVITEYNFTKYEVYDYVIMANHVHLLILVYEGETLPQILKTIKGVSARKINLYSQRSGALWEREYFDRIVRNPRHFERIVEYITKNVNHGGILWAASAGRRLQSP